MQTYVRRCKEVSHPRDKEAWLEARKKYVTASEISSVLGNNPYKTVQELYLDKIGLEVPIPDNKHLQRGRYYEPLIIEKWAREEAGNAKYRTGLGLLASLQYPWLACTPDAVARYSNETVLLEVKCPNKMFSTPPAHYVSQVQLQMLVTGIKRAFLVAGTVTNGNISQLSTFPIELPEATTAVMIGKSMLFMYMVETNTFDMDAFL